MKRIWNIGKSLVVAGVMYFAMSQAVMAGGNEEKKIDSLLDHSIEMLIEEMQVENIDLEIPEYIVIVEMSNGSIVSSQYYLATEHKLYNTPQN